MEDVLEVYHRPQDPKRPLICLDEASKQLLAETRQAIAVERGKPKRVDAEYRRCGTASVFMLTAPLEGRRHVRVRERRTRKDFAEVIRELCDDLYADAERIVLVLDNLRAHKTAAVRQLLDRSGFAYRYLPAYSPDLSPIEPAWAKLKAELRRVAARTAEALHQALRPALDTITAQDAAGFFRHAGYSRPK